MSFSEYSIAGALMGFQPSIDGDFSVDLYIVMDIWVCLKMSCTPLYPMVLLIIIPMKNG